MKPNDIHRQLCEVYGEHAMSDSMVRRWMRHFNEGCKNVHEDPRSGQPSVVNEDLVHSLHFPQISRLLFHEIVSD
jgi:transposase